MYLPLGENLTNDTGGLSSSGKHNIVDVTQTLLVNRKDLLNFWSSNFTLTHIATYWNRKPQRWNNFYWPNRKMCAHKHSYKLKISSSVRFLGFHVNTACFKSVHTLSWWQALGRLIQIVVLLEFLGGFWTVTVSMCCWKIHPWHSLNFVTDSWTFLSCCHSF